MINIGVIGYGYWGPNLVRNYAGLPEANLACVCDLDGDRLKLVQRSYPGVKTTTDPGELARDPKVDAIVIATPVSAHFELALQALRANKHVLVEKPIASNSEQIKKLIDEAEKRKRTLMVDHTFVYTGAVRKIHDLVSSGSLGDIYYYDSVRVNLGLFQHDVSVLWDLAVHDLSIMDYTLTSRAQAVSATGTSHVPGQPANVAYLTVYCEDNLIGHVHVNWLAPVKVRQTLIGGSRQMIVYDDLEPSEKIKIYDKGITISDSAESRHQQLIGYRTGDMIAPKLDGTEALRAQAAHFVDCIESKKTPITDAQAGLRVVQILEAAAASLEQRGKPVELG
ncbi:MAG: Gfo/Idh/MocA family oxidoreductase [Phycisphaerae bacterium]|nr:Gfo/Idh/MocA family oxidoreductase [Phycisphaerae bacterium]